jgi:hypothetical protein
MLFPGKSSARWRLFWRWLHVGRFHPPSLMEAALAAWPAMLWAGPPGTLPRALLPTARRRQWARAVMALERARQEREAAQLAAAGWVEWTLRK